LIQNNFCVWELRELCFFTSVFCGIINFFLNYYNNLLFGWWNWFGKHDSGVWNLVPSCLMWTLWTECNCRIFEDKTSSVDQLKGALVNSLFDWAGVGFNSENPNN
jgi:hypothetical protein